MDREREEEGGGERDMERKRGRERREGWSERE